MQYYIYIYLDPTNVPFYVGKGRGYRYLVSSHLQKDHGNKFLQNKILKVGIDNIKIEFPQKDLTELESFDLEKQYIQRIGRRDKGQGPLCNLTNGGEGPSLSEETKRKISEAHIGLQAGDKHPMYGKNHSEISKQKISKALKDINCGWWNKGLKRSEETKQKISKALTGKFIGSQSPMYGYSPSKETRRKMSEAKKGKPSNRKVKKSGPLSEETKRKMSEAHKGIPSWNKGKKMSEEFKRKMRDTTLRYWRKNANN